MPKSGADWVSWLQLLCILNDETDFSVARDDGDLRVLYKLEKGAANRSILAPMQPLKQKLGAPCLGAMIHAPRCPGPPLRSELLALWVHSGLWTVV